MFHFIGFIIKIIFDLNYDTSTIVHWLEGTKSSESNNLNILANLELLSFLLNLIFISVILIELNPTSLPCKVFAFFLSLVSFDLYQKIAQQSNDESIDKNNETIIQHIKSILILIIRGIYKYFTIYVLSSSIVYVLYYSHINSAKNFTKLQKEITNHLLIQLLLLLILLIVIVIEYPRNIKEISYRRIRHRSVEVFLNFNLNICLIFILTTCLIVVINYWPYILILILAGIVALWSWLIVLIINA